MNVTRGLAALCLLGVTVGAGAAPPGVASIEVVITPRTDGVRVSIGTDQADLEMSAKKDGELFTGQVELPGSESSPPPPNTPVDILATTPDSRTLQLYARVSPRDKSTVTFRVFVPDASKTTVNDVIRIDQLFRTSEDLKTTLEVYFASREIYRHWAAASPQHVAAIRSAKLWFDSAYRLATSGKQPRYRMDEGARKVLKEYEASAKDDPNLSKVLRQVMVPGYLSGMEQHLDTLVFRDAALVADLVAAGSLASARKLNEDLLQTFSALSTDQKVVAMRLQGVSEKSLKDNQAFITTLVDAKSGTTGDNIR